MSLRDVRELTGVLVHGVLTLLQRPPVELTQQHVARIGCAACVQGQTHTRCTRRPL